MNIILDENAIMPERAHDTDAGLDLKSPIARRVPAGGSAIIDTGVHVEIPEGYCGVLISKSGLNVKHNLTSTGLIDCGYTGSVCVKLYNHGPDSYQIERGDKISQLVILPCLYEDVTVVENFTGDSPRGAGGFGSTGR